MRANCFLSVIRCAFVFAPLFLATVVRAQVSLSSYLAVNPVSGPMIVVDPDSVRSRGASLSDFDRALMREGGLSVVAPISMVQIDETFAPLSTVYGGLDHDSKLVYLLTLLNSDEWARLVSSGLSASDLRGEARSVMLSLLPDPFGWSTWKGGIRTASGTTPGDEREHVRLKLSRGFNFLVNLAGQPKAYESISSCDLVEVEAVDRADKDERNPFGVQPRRSVPNKSKPSQLDYSAHELDKPLELKRSETIGALLGRVQAMTGIELHCDFRVNGLKVVAYGASCRSGDALQALALAVTGTYRKIGPAYELSSDIEGIGSRKVALELWEASRAREVEHLVSGWRANIGLGGHLAQIAFPVGASIEPNAVMLDQVRQSETRLSTDMVSTEGMSPWVRPSLDQFNIDHPDRPIDSSKAALQAEFECSYILPDGRELHAEPSLRSPVDYAGPGQTVLSAVGAPKPPYTLTQPNSDPAVRSAIVQAGDPDEARWLVDLLHRFGFREVWMEAARPETLAAAADRSLKDGISLRLLVRPWALPSDFRVDDEESTILGDRGDQLAVREARLDLWAALSGELHTAPKASYRCLSPVSNANYSRWAAVAMLARTPGLYGMVFEDLQPFGYEGHRNQSFHSLLEKPLGEMSDYGYGVRQRLEFLREHSLDPIDTVGDWLNLKSDVRQPFFPDNAIDPFASSDPFDSRLKTLVSAWDRGRAVAFSKAVGALFDNLPKNLPGGILVEPARGAINDRAPRPVQYVDSAAAALTYMPKTTKSCAAGQAGREFARIFRFQEDSGRNPSADADRSLFEALASKSSIALDFRSVRVLDLAAVLDRNFMQVVSIKIQKIDH